MESSVVRMVQPPLPVSPAPAPPQCPELDLSLMLSPERPGGQQTRTQQVCFGPSPDSSLDQPPVTMAIHYSNQSAVEKQHSKLKGEHGGVSDQSDGQLTEGVELNTTLALKTELLQLEKAEFNSQDAVRERLQNSTTVQECVRTRAAEGVNFPRSHHLYRALVSVSLSQDELIAQALRDRPVLAPPTTSHLSKDGSGSGWCGACENENGSYNWDYSDYWAGRSSAFSHSELVAVTTLCVPLLLLGLMGNILTILVVWLRPQMRSTTYFYLSSMAVSDIMMLVLMPLDLYKLWWYRPWFLGDVVCKLSQFVSECCTFSSILHMTALGAERYVGVCFPLRARLLVTRGRVRVLIGALWGVAALSAGPVLVLVGVERVEGNLTECRVTRWAESSGLMVGMLWLSNLYFIIPLTTLTLLYTLIARRLRQRRH
ncbi:growth hormone secretagogue receptor type 1-like, partial [Clarias magur]